MPSIFNELDQLAISSLPLVSVHETLIKELGGLLVRNSVGISAPPEPTIAEQWVQRIYDSFKNELDPFIEMDLTRLRFITINLPFIHHMKSTSKQLKKLFQTEIAKMRRYGIISSAVLTFEYSKEFKFHCHGVLKVNPTKDKKYNKHVYSFQKKMKSMVCYKNLRIRNKKSLKNILQYICKDVPLMLSRELVIQKFGNYMFEDKLYYKPYICKVACLENSTKPFIPSPLVLTYV